MKEINKKGVYLFSFESGADVMTYFAQKTLCCSLSPHGEAYDIYLCIFRIWLSYQKHELPML